MVYEPQPKVKDGRNELYTLPMPPKVAGEFQMILIALTSLPKSSAIF